MKMSSPSTSSTPTSSSLVYCYQPVEAGNYKPEFFPVIKQAVIRQALPTYAAVLAKHCLDDQTVNELQCDLEKLLSNAVVRRRRLMLQMEAIDHKLVYKANKATPSSEKRTSVHSLESTKTVTAPRVTAGNQKVGSVNKRTSNKFWRAVEPYCKDVGSNNLKFLDKLIQECSQPTDVAIPEVGEHYSAKWSNELFNSFKHTQGKKSAADLQKSAFNSMVDTFSSPLTQRLLGALIEETDTKPLFKDVNVSDFQLPSIDNFPKEGVCMDDWLRSELVNQGICNEDDFQEDPNDSILLEIQKSVEELKAVNQNNLSELRKLRLTAGEDLQRQQVKETLEKIDNQVGNMYSSFILEGQGSALHGEIGEEVNKIVQEQVQLSNDLLENDARIHRL